VRVVSMLVWNGISLMCVVRNIVIMVEQTTEKVWGKLVYQRRVSVFIHDLNYVENAVKPQSTSQPVFLF